MPLFSRPHPRIIDVARFGQRRTWKEVQATMQAINGSTHYEVLGQLIAMQHARHIEAVQTKSNLPNNQTAFEAGGAAALADLLDIYIELAQNKCKDGDLATWFGATKPE